MSPLARIRAIAPPSAVAAGLIAVTVGVTSAAAIVFTAARAAGADAREVSSWMLALGVGIAVTCAGLSLRYKAPIVTSWSTPGAALLATSLSGVSMEKAVGAFVFSAVLIMVSGLTGWFARIMDRIPVPLASALLGGVLLEFGTGLFSQMGGSFTIAFPVFVLYLFARRLLPRYAVLIALGGGVVASVLTGGWHVERVRLSLAQPVFTAPEFDWKVLVSVGVPLFVVTMASQNLPGVAVLRGSGYEVPVSPVLTWTGAVQAVLAPFGAFGMNLAAMTAAICTGDGPTPTGSGAISRLCGRASSISASACSARPSPRCSPRCRTRSSWPSPGSACSPRSRRPWPVPCRTPNPGRRPSSPSSPRPPV